MRKSKWKTNLNSFNSIENNTHFIEEKRRMKHLLKTCELQSLVVCNKLKVKIFIAELINFSPRSLICRKFRKFVLLIRIKTIK